jgi:hypothetical protein
MESSQNACLYQFDDKHEYSIAMIPDNRRTEIKNIITHLETSKGSAHITVYDILG